MKVSEQVGRLYDELDKTLPREWLWIIGELNQVGQDAIKLETTNTELLEALKDLLKAYDWALLQMLPGMCTCGKNEEIPTSAHDWACPYRALFRDNNRPFIRSATEQAIRNAEEQA